MIQTNHHGRALGFPSMTAKDAAEMLRTYDGEAGKGTFRFGSPTPDDMIYAAEAIERHLRNQPIDVDSVLADMHEKCEVMLQAELGVMARKVTVQCHRIIVDWCDGDSGREYRWRVHFIATHIGPSVQSLHEDAVSPELAIDLFRTRLLPILVEHYAEAGAAT